MILTKQQLKIFDFIVNFKNKNRVAPTVREIAKATYKNTKHHSSVWRILIELDKKGYIKKHTAMARGIEVLK